MDIKEIRRLVKLMVDNDLSELDVADGEQSIHLKRGTDVEPVRVVHAGGEAPGAPAAAAEGEPALEAPGEELHDIRSPMVGTFYTSSSPEEEPFVSVGDAVSQDTPVCIIEAMKVMNEIKAECSGTVAEVCVQNAQPVEYGQVIFRVRPA